MAVDHYSKWVLAHPIRDKRAQTIVAIMERLILPAVLKVPERILTDNGPEFRAGEFERLMESFNISHVFTSPLRPASNGAIERVNRTIGEFLRSLVEKERKEWDVVLSRALVTYNLTVHAQTGRTPSARLLEESHRHGIVIPVPAEEREKWVVGHPNFCPFRVGQLVLRRKVSGDRSAKRKLAARYMGPFCVRRVNQNGVTYEIVEEGKVGALVQKVHHRHLKPWIQPPKYLRDYYALEQRAEQVSEDDPLSDSSSETGVDSSSSDSDPDPDSDSGFSGFPDLPFLGRGMYGCGVTGFRAEADSQKEGGASTVVSAEEFDCEPAISLSTREAIRRVPCPERGDEYLDLAEVSNELSHRFRDCFNDQVRKAVRVVWADLFQGLIDRGERTNSSGRSNLCLICRDELAPERVMKDAAVQVLWNEEERCEETWSASGISLSSGWDEPSRNFQGALENVNEAESCFQASPMPIRESTRIDSMDSEKDRSELEVAPPLPFPVIYRLAPEEVPVDREVVIPDLSQVARQYGESSQGSLERGRIDARDLDPEFEGFDESRSLAVGGRAEKLRRQVEELNRERVEPQSDVEILERGTMLGDNIRCTRSRGRPLELPNVQPATLEYGGRGSRRGRGAV